MLTKDQIRKNLEKDPFWEPEEDASDEEWDLFDEVLAEQDNQITDDDDSDDDDDDDEEILEDDDEDPNWPNDEEYA